MQKAVVGDENVAGETEHGNEGEDEKSGEEAGAEELANGVARQNEAARALRQRAAVGLVMALIDGHSPVLLAPSRSGKYLPANRGDNSNAGCRHFAARRGGRRRESRCRAGEPLSGATRQMLRTRSP